MDQTQQARAVAIDLAQKLLAGSKQQRSPRAAEVVEIAKVFHKYMVEGK